MGDKGKKTVRQRNSADTAKSVFSVCIDETLEEWLDAAAKVLSVSRSAVIRELVWEARWNVMLEERKAYALSDFGRKGIVVGETMNYARTQASYYKLDCEERHGAVDALRAVAREIAEACPQARREETKETWSKKEKKADGKGKNE